MKEFTLLYLYIFYIYRWIDLFRKTFTLPLHVYIFYIHRHICIYYICDTYI